MQHHILKSTKSKLGTLAGGLGCLPLDNEAYPPLSDSHDTVHWHSEFNSSWYPGKGPQTISSSTPTNYYARLALKIFRREPAITEFDWPFTPIHSSSKHFSTRTGSVLHSVLPEIQPGHG